MRVIVNKKEIAEAVFEWLAKRNLKANKFGFNAYNTNRGSWQIAEDITMELDVEPVEVKDHPYR